MNFQGMPQPLGFHHFAHLRAVAEGVLSAQEAALRFLGAEDGRDALAQHRSVVERVRAVARRAGDRRWRLVGLPLGAARPVAPDIEQWAEEQGLLDEMSWREIEERYAQAFPPEAAPGDRRQRRDQRLLAAQLDALRQLERLAAERPRETDRLDAWFDPVLAGRLRDSGLLLLQDLKAVIQRGGRWWRDIPAVGDLKAVRIATHLQNLIPFEAAPQQFGVDVAGAPAGGDIGGLSVLAPGAGGAVAVAGGRLPDGPNRAPALAAAISARTDAEAVAAWVAARAGSQATKLSYEREARRFVIWAARERGKPLSGVMAEDCLAYMTFLQHIPPSWISRRRAKPGEPGWAPFAGPLTEASRRQAIVIVSGLFAWLTKGGYLVLDPWTLVNTDVFTEPANTFQSRAFAEDTWSTILAWMEAQEASPSRERALFVMRFVEATGLRASELVAGRLGDLRQAGRRAGWTITVVGKGNKRRQAAVPGQALEALERYLASRGLPALGAASPGVPLVANTADGTAPVGYHALYMTLRSWLTRAVRWSALTEQQRREAEGASVHWLRHTCATRAIERNAPLDVVQRQLGHSDQRMTERYATTQTDRLIDSMNAVFGRQ